MFFDCEFSPADDAAEGGDGGGIPGNVEMEDDDDDAMMLGDGEPSMNLSMPNLPAAAGAQVGLSPSGSDDSGNFSAPPTPPQQPPQPLDFQLFLLVGIQVTIQPEGVPQQWMSDQQLDLGNTTNMEMQAEEEDEEKEEEGVEGQSRRVPEVEEEVLGLDLSTDED